MIKILKLVSGESIIGELEADSVDPAVVYDPMIIEVYRDRDHDTHMKLISAVSLSVSDYLVFERKHILTYYQPLNIMVKYYNEVRPFGAEDKKLAEEKIGEALESLIEDQQEEKELLDKINQIFVTQGVANTNIH